MNYQSLLTTTDNPFDPFEQFTQWQLFDAQKRKRYVWLFDANCQKFQMICLKLSAIKK